MTLCNLSDVKDYLGITDNSQDNFLNLMIKQVSSMIEGYIGKKLARNTYNEELHSVNNNQLLRLSNSPIQSVSEVTINDVEIEDYKLIAEYAQNGFLYRGSGWNGNYYTRGMEHDIVSGEFSIKVSYVAGYYLPGDEGYVEGAAASLPYEIVTACIFGVAERYNIRNSQAEGIKAHSEGGISTTFNGSEGSNGLSASVISMIEDFKEIGVA